MPQISSVVLTDSQIVPVDHSYSVMNKTERDGYSIVSLAAFDALGEPHLASNLEFQSKLLGDGARRTKVRLVHPFTHDAQTETTAVDNSREENIAMIDVRLNPLSTTAQREDLRAMLIDLVNEATFGSLVEGFEGVWT